MRKIFSIICMAIATNLVCAQTVSETESPNYKATKGKFVSELNFNPFKGNLSLNNALNQIKGRYFLQDNLALRLGFNINVIDSAINYGNPYGTESAFTSNERKATEVGINLGIEKHFTGTKRLSPYVGLDLSWGKRSAKQDISSSAYEMNIKNGWMEIIYQQTSNGYYTSTQIIQTAYTRFGVYAIAGFDFYMTKNFLLGYEFNLGYLKTDYETPELTVTGQNPGYGSYVSNSSTKSFRTSLINGIRIGYAF